MEKELKDRLKAGRKRRREGWKKAEAERKAKIKPRPPEEVYSLMKKRKEVADRMVKDLTVDVSTLRKLSEKPERPIEGRRGKNLFRAYLWIGR